MKYNFKRYLSLPILPFEKNSAAYLSMIEIGLLYQLAYTNQRSYFYTNESLGLEDQGKSVFSLEGIQKGVNGIFGKGYQRRLQDERLYNIAKFLILGEDKNNILYHQDDSKDYLENLGKKFLFPNNIIVSLNNELWNPTNIHALYIIKDQATNQDDFDDFKRYIDSNTDYNDDGSINLDNKFELCRVSDKNSSLLIPIFELSSETTDEEVMEFAQNSPIYAEEFEANNIAKIRELENLYKLAWIIDGQHRTFSIKFLDRAIDAVYKEVSTTIKKHNIQVNIDDFFSKETIKKSILETKIAITTFLRSDITEQANIFIDINNNAKPVDKSLTFDLLPLTDKSNSIQLACKKIFDEFNRNPDSPLYNYLFSIRSQNPKSNKSLKILSQANFINELKGFFKFNNSSGGVFYNFYETRNLTPAYWLLHSYFQKINIAYSDIIFDKEGLYKDKEYGIYRTTGFGALLKFLEAFLYKFNDIKNLATYDKKVYMKGDGEFDKLLELYISRIRDKFDFKRSTIGDFRGKAGQKELADQLIILSGLGIDQKDWTPPYKEKVSRKIFEKDLFLQVLKDELKFTESYSDQKSVENYVATLKNLIHSYESSKDKFEILKSFSEAKNLSIDAKIVYSKL